MATIAAPRPAEARAELVRRGASRVALLLLVLALLWALWEAVKWFGERVELKLGDFVVNDVTMPHLHEIVAQLFEP